VAATADRQQETAAAVTPHGDGVEPNPALVRHAEERAKSVENRIADGITSFAGSLSFVYLHIVWFGQPSRATRRWQ
jgi:uncharacterized membrane protein